MRYLKLRGILITIVVLLICSLCISCSKPAQSEVELVSLDVVPPEATVGEPVGITVQVKNSGSLDGIYNAILNVDGAQVETKDVAVLAGATKAIDFSLTENTPGTYTVSIGELSSSLTVKPKPVEDVELKYDDGHPKNFLSTFYPTCGGHIVDFSPTAPFVIKTVRVDGMISPKAVGVEGKTLDVQILDKSLKVLHSATYPYSSFAKGKPTWVEFEIPNIEVADKFYVHIYTASPYPGLPIGVDYSVANEHSDVTVRSSGGTIKILPEWPYTVTEWWADKSKVNWMIRVVGTYDTSKQ